MNSKRLAINALHLPDGEADDAHAKGAPESPATPPLPVAAPGGPSGAAPAQVPASAVPIRDEGGAHDQVVAELMNISPHLMELMRACLLRMRTEFRKLRYQSRSRSPSFRRSHAWFPGPPARTSARRTRSTWRPNNSKV